MLVRIKSGERGIKDYLEDGFKREREFERDLVDERITLAGNLDVVDAVIDSIETKQAGDSRYLHITLGFAERFTSAQDLAPGQINTETIRQVVDTYKQLLFAAYDPSEYAFYAEAHIPKVTHQPNATTGDYEERLPHVHIVVPMRNLESGRYLNPTGFGDNTEWAMQAVQEHINDRYGLKSPLDARRDPGEVLHPSSKHTADVKGQSPRQLRAYLDALVREGSIGSFSELIEAAQTLGAVVVRHGKEGDYINVKPAWAERGINLKDLTREGFDDRARELRSQPPPPSRFDEDLERWIASGAFEARYVDSPKTRSAYKAMSQDERSGFLDQCRTETQARLRMRDKPLNFQILEAASDAIERALAGIESRPLAVPVARGLQDRLKLIIKEFKNERPERDERRVRPDHDAAAADRPGIRADSREDGDAGSGRADQNTGEASRPAGGGLGFDQDEPRHLTDIELKRSASGHTVISRASELFGLDPSRYSVGRGRDGSPRIIYDAHQYNVGDFFTKHLGRPWAEARQILLECQDRGPNDAVPQYPPSAPSGDSRGTARGNAQVLRDAAACIARGEQIARRPGQIERYIEHRNLGSALTAALRRLRGDREADPSTLTPQDRLALAGAAIRRAADLPLQRAVDALTARDELRAITFIADRLTRPTAAQAKTRTVSESLARETASRRPSGPTRVEPDPAKVLEAAQGLYGIDPKDYLWGRAKDGRHRIYHQNRTFSLTDFFTKHLDRPYSEAVRVLADCTHATASGAIPAPERALWRQFGAWREEQFRRAAETREAKRLAFREQVLETRRVYLARKEDARSLSTRQRRIAVAIARAETVTSQLRIAGERRQARAEGRIPGRNEHYRQFLVDLANAGDTAALAELRRIAPADSDPNPKIAGTRDKSVFPLPRYTVDSYGGVAYKIGDATLVRDSAQGVAVLQAEQAAYDAALRVAIAKYGRSITLRGDETFVARMVEAAKRSGIEIVIRDGAHPKAQPIVVNQRGMQR